MWRSSFDVTRRRVLSLGTSVLPLNGLNPAYTRTTFKSTSHTPLLRLDRWRGKPEPIFYCVLKDAQPVDRYRQGGYHPTHLGDLFKHGRYRIEDKLGWEGYGTVWLAKDQLCVQQA